MTVDTILAGIIAGVLSSILVLFGALVWKRIFIPWLENRLYKGTRIGGTWRTEMTVREIKKHEHATLKQYGHKIEGLIHYPEDTEGRSHTYFVEGEFKDRTLTLIQRELGYSHQDLGAIVLDFKPGGSAPIMEGVGVWSEEGEIVTVKYKWTFQSCPSSMQDQIDPKVA